MRPLILVILVGMYIYREYMKAKEGKKKRLSSVFMWTGHGIEPCLIPAILQELVF